MQQFFPGAADEFPFSPTAQVSSGVRRFRLQEQGMEEGSGRFRRVPARAGRFRRQVPEGSGKFRRALGSGGKFRKVPESSGARWRRRQVAEGSGEFPHVLFYRFRRQVPEGSGTFRCVLAPEACRGRLRKVPVLLA